MDLEDPNQWDLEHAEERPAYKPGRSVFSVSFPSDDFQVVCKAAERGGMTVSAFIRDAALHASHETPIVYSITWSAGMVPCGHGFSNVTH